MKYRTIYADPPWSEFGGGQIKRGADRHYPLMHTRDICGLWIPVKNGDIETPMSIKAIAEDDAHLYLWATNNKLLDALEVVKAWGFEYKTLITWAKDRFGLGQYYRGQTEHVIFATRGVCPYRLGENGKRAQGRTLIDGFDAPHGEHSVKPEVMRQWIESVSPRPYLELFARRKAEGWDSWGNEIE
jgi:N6-adenosine-specific RNA methylase IME4